MYHIELIYGTLEVIYLELSALDDSKYRNNTGFNLAILRQKRISGLRLVEFLVTLFLTVIGVNRGWISKQSPVVHYAHRRVSLCIYRYFNAYSVFSALHALSKQ